MRTKILLLLSCVLMVAALFMVFVYVPTDAEMGVIQRIFYFHVPLAWVAFLAFFIVFIGSILYLSKRDQKWDSLAVASGEIGVVFTTLVLISGSIWAKPIWGVWWTWDPRLTTSLILWIIYVAYFIIRSYIPEDGRKARFAAVVGIVGFIDVPIVALAISLSRTQHPSPLIFQGGLAPPMLLTLIVSIVAFTVVYLYLLNARLSLGNLENEAKSLKQARRLA